MPMPRAGIFLHHFLGAVLDTKSTGRRRHAAKHPVVTFDNRGVGAGRPDATPHHQVDDDRLCPCSYWTVALSGIAGGCRASRSSNRSSPASSVLRASTGRWWHGKVTGRSISRHRLSGDPARPREPTRKSRRDSSCSGNGRTPQSIQRVVLPQLAPSMHGARKVFDFIRLIATVTTTMVPTSNRWTSPAARRHAAHLSRRRVTAGYSSTTHTLVDDALQFSSREAISHDLSPKPRPHSDSPPLPTVSRTAERNKSITAPAGWWLRSCDSAPDSANRCRHCY